MESAKCDKNIITFNWRSLVTGNPTIIRIIEENTFVILLLYILEFQFMRLYSISDDYIAFIRKRFPRVYSNKETFRIHTSII